MLGSISGDICGSTYEGSSCPRNKVELFRFGSTFTDDTVCTIAIAQAHLENRSYADCLRYWAARYPNRGYGGMFLNWVAKEGRHVPSFSNGGAMRVSPLGLLARTIEEAEQLATDSAIVTHGHPEGLKGAKAVAVAIFLARHNMPAEIMRTVLETRYGYNLHLTVSQLAQDSGFTTLAEETVPQALICALEANSWEEAVENAVEVGGDSDTLACMAGGVAEARFGIAPRLAQLTWTMLPDDMKGVLTALYVGAGMVQPWLLPEQSPPQRILQGLLRRSRTILGLS